MLDKRHIGKIRRLDVAYSFARHLTDAYLADVRHETSLQLAAALNNSTTDEKGVIYEVIDNDCIASAGDDDGDRKLRSGNGAEEFYIGSVIDWSEGGSSVGELRMDDEVGYLARLDDQDCMHGCALTGAALAGGIGDDGEVGMERSGSGSDTDGHDSGGLGSATENSRRVLDVDIGSGSMDNDIGMGSTDNDVGDRIRKIVRRGEQLELLAKPYVLLLGGRVRRAGYVLCGDGGQDDAERKVWVGVCMGEWHGLIREVELCLWTWL